MIAEDGNVYDTDRILFLRAFLTQLQRAIEDGVPVNGYFQRVATETQATPDDDGQVREHLANERTLLARIRPGLAAAGFDFIVARFELFLREFAGPEAGATPGGSGRARSVGRIDAATSRETW